MESDVLKDFGLTDEESDQQISDTQLEKISRTCITRWRSLPPYLEVSSITIDDIDHDSNKEEEKRNDFFSDWKLKNGSRATYKKLLHGLLEIGCRDDAEKVCRLLREYVSTLEQNSGTTSRRSIEKSVDPIASQSASDSGQLGEGGAGWDAIIIMWVKGYIGDYITNLASMDEFLWLQVCHQDKKYGHGLKRKEENGRDRGASNIDLCDL